MDDQKLPKPTDAELEILHVMWDLQPCTVRQVHEVLCEKRNTGYTTTLKLMQIMAEKGLAVRDASNRTHIYKANTTQAGTQKQLVQTLLDRAFAGSAKNLIMQALSAKVSSAQELAEIRELLDSLEKEKP